MDKLAIITVNYNNYSETQSFISYLSKSDNKSFKLFITDCSSNREIIKVPDFVEIIYTENDGYASGLNAGLRAALSQGYSKFVFINNDVKVPADFVGKVISSITINKSSLIGGKIYYYPGSEYHKSRYKKSEIGRVFWYAGGIVDWKNSYTIHRGVDIVDHGQFDNTVKTEFITGCLMCFDSSFLKKVGYMDEKYFLYYEDADWCERAKRLGMNLIYDPNIVIWHKNSQSTGGSGSDLHVSYQEKNRVKFGLKYAPFRTKIHLVINYYLK